MLLAILASALSLACSNAAPALMRRNVATASERLGLTWLGSNATLPKVLLVRPEYTRVYGL